MLDEEREKVCFDIFRENIGHKLAVRHWKEIYLCFLAVDFGLKTSYLVDQCCLQPVKVNRLVEHLCRERFLSRNDLYTALIFGDTFILQREATLSHLNRVMNEQLTCFVDVSGRLTEPKMVEKSDSKFWNSIRKFCEAFSDFIQCYRADEDAPFIPHFEIEIVHPCTVFGLILGYPTVYWLDERSEMNCLSHTNLTVSSCEIALAESSQANYFVTASSFSFPEELSVLCETHVQAWKRNIAELSQKCTIFIHRFICKQVRLPAVIL